MASPGGGGVGRRRCVGSGSTPACPERLSALSQVGVFAQAKLWLARELAGTYDAEVCVLAGTGGEG